MSLFPKPDEDEDDLFASHNIGERGGGDTLRSIFSQHRDELHQPHKSSDNLLRYQAPKQPRFSVDDSADKSIPEQMDKPSKTKAFTVDAFMLESGQYKTEGRLGLAIVSHKEKEHLLLYKSNKEKVAFATITEGFRLTLLADNYVTFADNRQRIWAVRLMERSDLEALESVVESAKLLVASASSTVQPTEKPCVDKKEETTQQSTTINIKASAAVNETDDNRIRIEKMVSKVGQSVMPRVRESTKETSAKIIETLNAPESMLVHPMPKNSSEINMRPTAADTISSHFNDSRYMDIILAENRLQNTEMRLSLMRMDDKIDRVLSSLSSCGSDRHYLKSFSGPKKCDVAIQTECSEYKVNEKVCDTNNEDLIHAAKETEAELKESRYITKQLERENSALQVELTDLKSQLEEKLELQRSKLVKKTLSRFYKELQADVDLATSYAGDEILNLIARKMRGLVEGQSEREKVADSVEES